MQVLAPALVTSLAKLIAVGTDDALRALLRVLVAPATLAATVPLAHTHAAAVAVDLPIRACLTLGLLQASLLAATWLRAG